MQSQPKQIQRVIFQGDSPSPLLFCIPLISLTHKLSRPDCGSQVHRSKGKISHLLHMGDFKLLGSNEDDLENEIKTLKAIIKDINMNFRLEKCVRIC